MVSKTTKFAIQGLLMLVVCVAAINVTANDAEAGRFGRQYYSSWSYHPTQQYHYCRYYYQPTVRTQTYHYHYVIYYPSRPRYRYYYNPVRRVYWGRYEVDCKGNPVGYSMLKPEDRKSKLSEIDESKFPPASEMPKIPESADGDDESILPPTDVPTDLPEIEIE